MTYKYRYDGEQAITLPALGINTEGKDKDFVYETTEPINHPDFSLVEDRQEQESSHEEERTQEEGVPETQTENVAQEGERPIQ